MNISRSVASSPMRMPSALSHTGWLAEQPADFQARMVALGSWKTFGAGQALYEVGDPANGVFGLEDGLIDISIAISDDELVTLHRAGPGLWGGDSALFADAPRIASLTASRVRPLSLPLNQELNSPMP